MIGSAPRDEPAARPCGALAGPLRVTLVTHYFPAHRGGVERVAGELAGRLAQAGVACVQWHASDCDPQPAATPGVQCAPAASWNALERLLGLPYPLWSPAALARLARAARAADVVHLHDFLYLPNLVAFAAARLAGRPVLVTQHVGFVPYRNPALRFALRAANFALGRLVLGRAARVAFESEAVRRYFARFVRFRSAPLLVPNGVDTEVFAPVGPEERRLLREKLGARAACPLLLFVGRFVEKKGLRVLEELTARLPQAHWVIAGWGPLDPAAWGRTNVTVVRAPRPEDLPPLYRAADLFVLPSVGEGFPLALQEAMACGTPVLAGAETAAGCAPEGAPILAEKTGGQDTAGRWHARLGALLAEPEALERMRPQVAEFARAHWSWDRCVARYEAILRACVATA